MRELGNDAGTLLRVLFNFETEEQLAEEASRDSSSSRRHHSSLY
jgi:hypothetical protein